MAYLRRIFWLGLLVILGGCVDKMSDPATSPGFEADHGTPDGSEFSPSGPGDTSLANCVVTWTQFGSVSPGDRIWVHTAYYNEYGRVTLEEVDCGKDGFDDVWSYFWDESQRLVRKERDEGGDGSIDRAWTWEDLISEEGMRTLMTETAPNSPDKLVLTFYDSSHRWQLEETDLEDDGQVDSLRTAAYIGDSRRLSELVEDSDANGVADSVDSYFYDEAGWRTREEVDLGADDSLDSGTDYEYSAAGRGIQTVMDLDGDLRPDEIHRFEWDEFGHRTYRSEDTDADGYPDFRSRMLNHYDLEGRLIAIEVDDGDDGELDGSETWAYDCP